MHFFKSLLIFSNLMLNALAAPAPTVNFDTSMAPTTPLGPQHEKRATTDSLPSVIYPPGGNPAQPADTILIQIGFRYELNYPFVANNVASQQQIFQYTPQGLAFGLDLPVDQVTMQSLRPYDTIRELGYITTLALAYIPSNKVDQLQLQLSSPSSKLYNNPDPTVKQLFSLLNPNLPVLPQSS